MAEGPLSETRRKEPESEKITINLGFVDLGHIDLLVAEGFYSNRTDFIRTAIRNQVLTHGEVLKSSVARRSMVLGLQRFTGVHRSVTLARLLDLLSKAEHASLL